ncbi:MAG: glutaredoxin family protein [Planctomycetales bacterium]|nr:glutaredoxin family protein [Planctomycetales bacterium]
MQQLSATLYTRHGCHLCDKAKSILAAHGFEVHEVDIDGDELLKERFDCEVPVVAISGKIRFRGHIDERLLRRLLMRE